MTKLNVLDIIKGTTVDGPGLRTSIYLAGCTHHCPGCHNPQSWDENAGIEMSVQEILDIVREEGFNVTLSGGDPMMHPEQILPLVKAIHDEGYTIWLYTGYTLEQIMRDTLRASVLDYIDCLVDGPFIESLKDPDLRFRGSTNQRIIPKNQFT